MMVALRKLLISMVGSAIAALPVGFGFTIGVVLALELVGVLR